MEKIEIIKYIQGQMASTPERLQTFTHERSGKLFPKRHIYVKLQKYLADFGERKKETPRALVITGLRGVGKTTVMAQICASTLKTQPASDHILFLSLEEAVQVLGVGISEVLDAFEDVIGESLERTQRDIYLFLDEVQKDPQWSSVLRSLYEKNKNIFICCTGSSAVELQTNADLARRFYFEKLPPLSFGEYQMITHGTYAMKGLKQLIGDALYKTPSGKDAYARLLKCETAINQYWAKVDRTDIDTYLKVGTMPFALTMPKEDAVYDAISLMLDKVTTKDLLEFGRFDQDTLLAMKRLLFLMAESDTMSSYQLERTLGIKRLTVQNMLDTLEKTELLIRVPAYGSNMTVAKKPSKYLFMSPAIRMSFLRMTGNQATFQTRKGRLLEDLIGAHLYREFVSRGAGQIRHDAEQGGADFILQIADRRQIALEVGIGKKDDRQLLQTMKKISCAYGITFSSGSLSWDEEKSTLRVPLDYFFLA